MSSLEKSAPAAYIALMDGESVLSLREDFHGQPVENVRPLFEVQLPKCRACEGFGVVVVSGPHWQGEWEAPTYEEAECDECGGTGKAEQPVTVSVPCETLKKIRADLDACQRVIHLAGGFDPAYVNDAQARLKDIDDLLGKEGA